MSGYRLSRETLEDLDEIWFSIANDNVDAADRFIQRLLGACELLAGSPGLGHLREDLTSEKLLFWPVGSYLLVYRPGSDPLEIAAVLHGARDVLRLLITRTGL